MNPHQMITGDEEDWMILLERGQELFRMIQPDLNVLATNFTYNKNQVRSQNTYEEICLALAIYALKTEVTQEAMEEKKDSVLN